MGQKTTAWTKALFRFIDADPESPIKFSSFCHVITMFCMFQAEEMYHFCFHLVDTDEQGCISAAEFQKMGAMLAEEATVVYPAQLVRAFRKFDVDGTPMDIIE
jgi:Ca2+-binding EF-hand superfamily protein